MTTVTAVPRFVHSITGQPFTEPGWLDTWMRQIEMYAGHGWQPAKIAAFLEPTVNRHYRGLGARSAYLAADEVIEARARAQGIPERIAPALDALKAAVELREASAHAKANLPPRAAWVAWAWANGMKQRRIAAHLGLKTASQISTACMQYVTAHYPDELFRRPWGAVDNYGNRQELLARDLKGKPEPARPAEWRELRSPWVPPRRGVLGRPFDMGGPRDVWIEALPHERR